MRGVNQELPRMKIDIPPEFFSVTYDYDRHPQSASFDFSKGANCQLWAYAVLKHFGVNMPPFRSSELWEDCIDTESVKNYKPLAPGSVSTGRRFGFTTEYRDRDEETDETVKIMNWQGTPSKTNPFSGVDSLPWGDLVIADVSLRNTRSLHPRLFFEEKTGETEYYTLRGQRVHCSDAGRFKGRGVLIKQTRNGNHGRTISNMSW